jgi:hypothetical protein
MGAPVVEYERLDSAPLPEHLQVVADALQRLKYGVIQLTVHDGKLMQVDVTERRRFGK